MDIKEYVGDLIGGALFLTESRIIAESLLKRLPDDEWKLMIIQQNILQKKSSKTAIRYARTARLRLGNLGFDFMEELLVASERAYSQMLMMALIIDSPIVADFMKLSLAEAHRTYKPNLNSDAWAEFYSTKSRIYAEMNVFSDATVKKMGSNAIKSLVISGYLSDSKKKKIQSVYLTPEVCRWLERLDRKDLISVMECTI